MLGCLAKFLGLVCYQSQAFWHHWSHSFVLVICLYFHKGLILVQGAPLLLLPVEFIFSCFFYRWVADGEVSGIWDLNDELHFFFQHRVPYLRNRHDRVQYITNQPYSTLSLPSKSLYDLQSHTSYPCLDMILPLSLSDVYI